MKAKVTFAAAGAVFLVLAGQAAQSVEDRLAALERRVAELEQAVAGAKACRTGCAVMYAGQRAEGEEGAKWFRKAIADHGDCYYGDGACVGAYARLYLASFCEKQGKKAEAEKLKEEIRTLFPDAVTHKGRPMKDGL